jgi:hypothetical protein
MERGDGTAAATWMMLFTMRRFCSAIATAPRSSPSMRALTRVLKAISTLSMPG